MFKTKRYAFPMITLVLFCSAANAQIDFQQVAKFESPSRAARRITGGREVEFSDDGKLMIAAFYGSTAQLFDLKGNAPIGEPMRTAGDGEIGFVNNEIAFTADWNSVRLWDTKTGQQIGDAIRHELREDTIIQPAICPQGKFIATRASMKSVQLLDIEARTQIGELKEYSTEVNSIRFSADGEILFVKSGGLLYAIDSGTGEEIVDPFKSGWQFYHFPKQQKLVTTEKADGDIDRLVIRSTGQMDWPETHRLDLPGRLKRMVALNDNIFMLQASKKDYTPVFLMLSIDKPESFTELESNADRAFRVVVTPDKRHWICSNIRDITCQRFGESDPVWQKKIPPSGYDQRLYPLDNEHFIILGKHENFGVYKVSDGSQVWNQTGVKRFSLVKDRIALCNSEGIQVWALE